MGVVKEVHVVRSCDVCGKSVQFIAEKISPEVMRQSAGWYLICQEHMMFGPDGPQMLPPVQKLACSKKCAIECIEQNLTALPLSPRECVLEDINSVGPVDLSKVS